MIRLSKITILCILIVLTSLRVNAAPVLGNNQLRDVWLQDSSNGVLLVLAVGKATPWALGQVQNENVRLFLRGLSMGHRAEARIKQYGNGLISGFLKQGADLLSIIRLKRPLQRIDYSYSSQNSLLSFRFYWTPAGHRIRKYTDRQVVLKKLRYGKRAGFDRVVMEFTGKPSWSVEQIDQKHLIITINNCKAKYKEKPHGTRLIKDLTIKASTDDTRLELTTLENLYNFRVFWLEIGNRLVLDLMTSDSSPLVTATNLPQDFGKELIEKVGEKTVQKDNSQKKNESSPFKPFEVNILKELKEDQHASAAPKVVKKIPKRVQVQKLNKPSAPPSFSREFQSQAHMSKEEALHYGRILAAMNFKEYEEGIRLIDEFLQKYPQSSAREELLFMKGDFYLHLLTLGDSSKLHATLRAFNSAIQEYPHSPRVAKAYLKMARASRIAGDYYGAMGYLNLLFEKYKGEDVLACAYMERGLVYERLQLMDKAFQDYNTLIRLFPNSKESANARFGIARYLHNKGLYEEAEKWLKEIESVHPGFALKNPSFYLLRAKNDLYLKKFSRARKLFLMALNLGVNTEPMESLLTRVGDTYLYEGNKEAAKRLYAFVVTHFPESEGVSIAQLRMADLTSNVKKFKELYDHYGDKPLGELALLKLANIYFKNKAYDKAMTVLREMVLKPVKDEAGRAAKAIFYQACEKAIQQSYREKRYKECISLYEKNKVLVEGKLGIKTKLYLAEALLQTGEPKRALKVMGAFDPSPLSPKVRSRYVTVYAKALMEEGRAREVIDILEKERSITASRQQKALYSLFLGHAYQQISLISKALDSYKEAVANEMALNKRQRLEAWLEIGRIENRLGNAPQARSALRRCLQIASKAKVYEKIRLLALLEMAESYRAENNPREAAKILEDILQTGYGPDNENYWQIKFRLARCYEQMGEINKAKTLYKEMEDEGTPILQARAQMYLGSIELNNRLKALSHWSEIASR